METVHWPVVQLLLLKMVRCHLILLVIHYSSLLLVFPPVPGSPPDSIAFITSSPYNLTVDWSTPFVPNGVIIGYTMYIDFLNGTNITMKFDSQTLTYTILGLVPYQSVDVQLSASTTLGEGPISDVSIVRTLQTGMSIFASIHPLLDSYHSDTIMIVCFHLYSSFTDWRNFCASHFRH